MAAVRMVAFQYPAEIDRVLFGRLSWLVGRRAAGAGSERPLDDCLTLKDLDPASLAVIRRRAQEIAGVLVNPVQSFHPEFAAAQRCDAPHQ